jgi:hypothetical protein
MNAFLSFFFQNLNGEVRRSPRLEVIEPDVPLDKKLVSKAAAERVSEAKVNELYSP